MDGGGGREGDPHRRNKSAVGGEGAAKKLKQKKSYKNGTKIKTRYKRGTWGW